MTDRKYVCAYKHCLHNGEKVYGSDSVVVGKRHYHQDCAEMRQQIDECVNLYMDFTDDKTLAPIVRKIVNTLVFKNRVPVSFILSNIEKSKGYYSKRPPIALYGLKSIFWEKTV